MTRRAGARTSSTIILSAYHACMAASMGAGLHSSSAWEPRAKSEGGASVSVVRAAGLYMAAQMEPGHCCPLTMTNAAVPLLLQSA